MKIDDETLAAARDWFVRNDIDLATLSALAPRERALRLNYAVHNFCSEGPQTVIEDEVSLFESCLTACGGFSFVLRGLLEAAGAVTRYVHFFNIPNQGNHTAVEMEGDGGWMFLDPTFGVVLYPGGQSSDAPLAISDVLGLDSDAELASLAFTAKHEGMAGLDVPLTDLYGPGFEHPFMALEHYRTAETISHGDPDETIFLEIALNLSSGGETVGDFTSETLAPMQAAWLAATNARLNDADPEDHMSFNTSQLTLAPRTVTTVRGENAAAEEVHTLTLMFFNSDLIVSKIQIAPMGRGVNHGGKPVIEAAPGKTIIETTLQPDAAEFGLAIQNIGPASLVELLGVSVVRGKASTD